MRLLDQRRAMYRWFLRENVDGSVSDLAACKRIGKIHIVDDLSAGGIDDDDILLHLRNRFFADQIFGFLVERTMKTDDIRLSQQLFKGDPVEVFAFQFRMRNQPSD